jgi:hypothetical protein
MDELETHLRDLRFLKNIAPTHDKYLNKDLSAKARVWRKDQLEKDVQTLQSLLLKSKFILAQFQMVIRSNAAPLVSSIEGPFRISLYRIEAGGDFDDIVFKSKFIKNIEFQSAIFEQVQWAQKRVFEIKTELQNLSISVN